MGTAIMQAMKLSDEIYVYREGYGHMTRAMHMACLQAITLFIGLFNLWVAIALGVFAYVMFYVHGVRAAREYAKLRPEQEKMYLIFVIFSGLVYFLSPIFAVSIFGLIEMNRFQNLGIKWDLSNWRGYDFDGRILELRSEGK